MSLTVPPPHESPANRPSARFLFHQTRDIDRAHRCLHPQRTGTRSPVTACSTPVKSTFAPPFRTKNRFHPREMCPQLQNGVLFSLPWFYPSALSVD